MKKRLLALFSAVCLLLCAVPAAASEPAAVSTPAVSEQDHTQKLAYDMFGDLGFAAMSLGSNTYFDYGQNAPDGMVFYYLWTSGCLYEYYDDTTWEYHVPYADFIAHADAAFAFHSDMISYLGDRYDPETGIVSWYDGGWGDAVTWVPLTCYEEYGYVYVTGVRAWFDYAPEDFTADTYGKDWVYDRNSDETYPAMIDTNLIMMAEKTDDGLQLLTYREIDYHVVDGVLYDDKTDAQYNTFNLSLDHAYFYEAVESEAHSTSYYGLDGDWMPADATLTFGVRPHLGYAINSVTLGGNALTPNSNGLYEVATSAGMDLAVSAVATGEDITAQKNANSMFYNLGMCTWGQNYFWYNDQAPSDVVFQYMQMSGLLGKYYHSDTWSYIVPYDEYMALVDEKFANHSDMIAYLGDYYDPETGLITWFSGGFGGPTTWQPISYYEDGDYVYVAGVMADYGYDSDTFLNRTYGKEWMYVQSSDYIYPALIVDDIVLMARKTDNGLQIMAYSDFSYHIVDGILYDSTDDTEYCAFDRSIDNVYFDTHPESQATVFGFVGNGNRWVPKDLPMTFYVDPYYGYELVDVLFNGEPIEPDETGYYTVVLNQASTLEVNTVATHQFVDAVDLIVSPTPVAGEAISTDVLSVPADEPYEIREGSGFTWLVSDTPDGWFSPVQSDAVFETDKYYKISGILFAKDGYAFTDSTTASVNGETADSYHSFGNHIGLETTMNVHEHDLSLHEETAASYTQSGYLTHYECACGRWYEDADGKTEIIDRTPYILDKLVPVVNEGKAEVNEQAIADALERDAEEDTVTVPLEDVSEPVSAVDLPVAALQTVADAEKSLAVQTADVSVTLDATALQTIAEKSSDTDTVTLTIEKIAEETLNTEQQTALEQQTVCAIVSAEILCGNEAIHDFEGGEVTVQIPIAEEDHTDETVYAVLYIADDGSVEEYDAMYENGVLTVKLTHFSEYAVVKYTLGDINGDGTTDTSDARALLRYLVDLPNEGAVRTRAADLSGDAILTTADVRDLLVSIITE